MTKYVFTCSLSREGIGICELFVPDTTDEDCKISWLFIQCLSNKERVMWDPENFRVYGGIFGGIKEEQEFGGWI